MSTTQNYDFGADDLNKQQSLDSAEATDAGQGAQREGILGAASGAVGNISQVASNAVKQSGEAIVNAGKGIVEMGGSVISGLKRGFSKTSESGGDQ